MRRVVALQRSPVSQTSIMGRRPEAWHVAARAISPIIEAAVREAGYFSNLGATNENSPVAIIGAEAINRAYRINIESGAFATAMRARNRRRPGKADNEREVDWENYDAVFPTARRRGP
jgi:hypothetical protein